MLKQVVGDFWKANMLQSCNILQASHLVCLRVRSVNSGSQPFPGKAERPRVSTPRFDREGLAPWTSWPGARFRNRLHVSAENHFTATRCTGDMLRLLSEKILPDSEFEI